MGCSGSTHAETNVKNGSLTKSGADAQLKVDGGGSKADAQAAREIEQAEAQAARDVEHTFASEPKVLNECDGHAVANFETALPAVQPETNGSVERRRSSVNARKRSMKASKVEELVRAEPTLTADAKAEKERADANACRAAAEAEAKFAAEARAEQEKVAARSPEVNVRAHSVAPDVQAGAKLFAEAKAEEWSANAIAFTPVAQTEPKYVAEAKADDGSANANAVTHVAAELVAEANAEEVSASAIGFTTVAQAETKLIVEVKGAENEFNGSTVKADELAADASERKGNTNSGLVENAIATEEASEATVVCKAAATCLTNGKVMDYDAEAKALADEADGKSTEGDPSADNPEPVAIVPGDGCVAKVPAREMHVAASEVPGDNTTVSDTLGVVAVVDDVMEEPGLDMCEVAGESTSNVVNPHSESKDPNVDAKEQAAAEPFKPTKSNPRTRGPAHINKAKDRIREKDGGSKRDKMAFAAQP